MFGWARLDRPIKRAFPWTHPDGRLMNAVVIGAVAIILALIVWKRVAHRFVADEPILDQPLPTLALEPLLGNAPRLENALAGKVLLINFWGTWCPPCRAELPHVAALERQYHDRPDFRLISVSCGYTGVDHDRITLSEETSVVLQAMKWAVPVYVDPDGVTRHALADGHGDFVYPSTVLVNRHGKVTDVWRGFHEREFEQLKLRVATLLNEPR